MTRLLADIAREIRQDWHPVNYAAKPYLDAMREMGTVSAGYGADSGASVVRYFLSNATAWRGDTARRVKKELIAMVASGAEKRRIDQQASPRAQSFL